MVFNSHTGHQPGVQDYLFGSKIKLRVTLQLILAIYLVGACLIFA